MRRQMFVTAVKVEPINVTPMGGWGKPTQMVPGRRWVEGLILWDAPSEPEDASIPWDTLLGPVGLLPDVGSTLEIELGTDNKWTVIS